MRACVWVRVKVPTEERSARSVCCVGWRGSMVIGVGGWLVGGWWLAWLVGVVGVVVGVVGEGGGEGSENARIPQGN